MDSIKEDLKHWPSVPAYNFSCFALLGSKHIIWNGELKNGQKRNNHNLCPSYGSYCSYCGHTFL